MNLLHFVSNFSYIYIYPAIEPSNILVPAILPPKLITNNNKLYSEAKIILQAKNNFKQRLKLIIYMTTRK